MNLKTYKRIYLFVALFFLPLFGSSEISLDTMTVLVADAAPYSTAFLELTKEIAGKMKYNVHVIKGKHAQIFQEILSGKYDVILNQVVGKARDPYFIFSRPVFKVDYNLYGLATQENFSNASQMLGNYKTAYVDGIFYGDKFQTYLQEDQKMWSNSQQKSPKRSPRKRNFFPIRGQNPDTQGLLEVALGKVNFFVCSPVVCDDIKNDNKMMTKFPDLKKVVRTQAVLASNLKAAFAFSKRRANSQEFQQKFNKILGELLSLKKIRYFYETYHLVVATK